MEQKTYKLEEVEEVLFEMEIDCDCLDYEVTPNYAITYTPWYVFVPKYNFKLYSGLYSNWDEDLQEYEADFSLTLLKDAETDEFVYWEQDGFACTLKNFLKDEATMAEVSSADCMICNLDGNE